MDDNDVKISDDGYCRPWSFFSGKTPRYRLTSTPSVHYDDDCD